MEASGGGGTAATSTCAARKRREQRRRQLSRRVTWLCGLQQSYWSHHTSGERPVCPDCALLKKQVMELISQLRELSHIVQCMSSHSAAFSQSEKDLSNSEFANVAVRRLSVIEESSCETYLDKSDLDHDEPFAESQSSRLCDRRSSPPSSTSCPLSSSGSSKEMKAKKQKIGSASSGTQSCRQRKRSSSPPTRPTSPLSAPTSRSPRRQTIPPAELRQIVADKTNEKVAAYHQRMHARLASQRDSMDPATFSAMERQLRLQIQDAANQAEAEILLSLLPQSLPSSLPSDIACGGDSVAQVIPPLPPG